MPIPLKILNALHYGKSVAAELPPFGSCRAYVAVIPQVPSPRERPEAWINSDRQMGMFSPMMTLRDPASITGYDVLYISHDAKYTCADWGDDADYVLDDDTTRIRRVFVAREDGIESALSPWLTDLSQLRPPANFDSSLVRNLTLCRDFAESSPRLSLSDTPYDR